MPDGLVGHIGVMLFYRDPGAVLQRPARRPPGSVDEPDCGGCDRHEPCDEPAAGAPLAQSGPLTFARPWPDVAALGVTRGRSATWQPCDGCGYINSLDKPALDSSGGEGSIDVAPSPSAGHGRQTARRVSKQLPDLPLAGGCACRIGTADDGAGCAGDGAQIIKFWLRLASPLGLGVACTSARGVCRFQSATSCSGRYGEFRRMDERTFPQHLVKGLPRAAHVGRWRGLGCRLQRR